MEAWKLADGSTVTFQGSEINEPFRGIPEEELSRLGFPIMPEEKEEPEPDSDILSLDKWTGGNRVGKAFVQKMEGGT